MAAAFQLRVLAADHSFYEGPCESLILPTHDGELGIMAHHAELLTALVPGELRYRLPNEEVWHIGATGSGFAHVFQNRVEVLVETAELPEEIDEKRAQRAEQEAREILRQQSSLEQFLIAQASLARAMARLKIKTKRSSGQLP